MSGVEYRLVIERPGVHEPHAFLTTPDRWWAEMRLREERDRYRTWEPRTRIWIESRPVGEWVRWG